MARNKRPYTEVEYEIRRLYLEEKKTFKSIRIILGMSPRVVNNIMRYRFPEDIKRNVVLTPEQIDYIRTNPDNLLHQELAEKFGCSPFVIGKTKRQAMEPDQSIYFSDLGNPAFIFM